MTLKIDHLKGMQFSHGERDCYEILRDFYADNFGLTLSAYARPDGWWDKGMNLYMEHVYAEGFIQIEDHPLHWRPGDLILMAIRSPVANHSAIWLGQNQILHHFIDRLSNVEMYRGLWKNTTVGVFRHQALVDLPDLDLPTYNIMEDPAYAGRFK